MDVLCEEYLPKEYIKEVDEKNEYVRNQCDKNPQFTAMSDGNKNYYIALAAGYQVMLSPLGAATMLTDSGISDIINKTIQLARFDRWGEFKHEDKSYLQFLNTK